MSDSVFEVIDVAGAELREMRRLVGEAGEGAWDRLLDWLVADWFRLEVRGLEHVPSEGPALLVANHSGAWGLDAFVLLKVLARGLGRTVRVPAAPIAFRFPVLGAYARRHGAIPLEPTLGWEHLTAGELVGVFPEGVSGLEKPFRERYRLRPFSPGFAVTAIAAGAPVIPVSVIGAEETYPKFGEVPLLARLFDLPYFPVTSPVPLPAKWRVTVGPRIPAPASPAGRGARARVATEHCALVRARLQEMVDRDRRETPYW
ncbi:lysophospholipid acyltransferase family protein [Streptomyces sp. BI20]|uniref:lysophospholipid acyltransferase family protein n=1 Tax=Streptomyces sp. BI20 TaxID=3403460 RepID=UPI003C746C1A